MASWSLRWEWPPTNGDRCFGFDLRPRKRPAFRLSRHKAIQIHACSLDPCSTISSGKISFLLSRTRVLYGMHSGIKTQGCEALDSPSVLALYFRPAQYYVWRYNVQRTP